MGDCNTKLMAALLGGTSVDEVFRQEIETAVNNVLESGMAAFLGYGKHAVEGYNSGDSRNGGYERLLHTRFGDIIVKIPRDRNGKFKQKLIPPCKRYSDSLETTVIHLYQKGITTAEIASLIEHMYGCHCTDVIIRRGRCPISLNHCRTRCWPSIIGNWISAMWSSTLTQHS